MSRATYDEALRRLLLHEGGYTNHPSDPGGPTNFGITIVDYRKYVKAGATAADVKAMHLDEARAIYRVKLLAAAICDERLRFLQSLRTWDVFGKGWGRRVAEVRACSLALAAGLPVTSQAAASPTAGKGVVPVRAAAQQGSAGAMIVAGAAAAQQAHASGVSAWTIAAIAAASLTFAVSSWVFWQWRRERQQSAVA